MDLGLAVDQWADQVQGFSAFTGVIRPNPADRFFLVVGMTGSGKSSFVARCTGKDVIVSHGLYSCTDAIGVFQYSWNGRRIYLIDTPGFNDTNRSDVNTLDILATYLGASYANGVRIHGLIMLHPISDNRMSGASLRNIEMMKAMCGFTRYDNVVAATTMWPHAPSPAERATLERREAELLGDDRFFGTLVDQGAVMLRHNEGGCRDPFQEAVSAQKIVAQLIARSEMRAPEVLQLQRELIDEGKTLSDTTAGIVVAGELYKARQAHKRQLRELETALKDNLVALDVAHAAELNELKAGLEAKLREAEDGKRALKQRMQDLHEKEEAAWKKRIEAADKLFRERLAAQEAELLDLEGSLRELRRDRARVSWSRHQGRQVRFEDVEQESMVLAARDATSRSHAAYQKFRDQKGNIVNGTANGLAAGITTALIAGAVSAGLVCTVM